MSAAGAATFNSTVTASAINAGSSNEGVVKAGILQLRSSNTASSHFFRWDVEGVESANKLVGYWNDGNYRDRLSIAGNTGETVVNDSGLDVDFRVESDGKTHALFVDGGLNNVGVGYSAAHTATLQGISILSGGEGGGIQINREDGSTPSSGELLGSLAFKGTDSANNNTAADASIVAQASQDHSGSAAGANLLFKVKANNVGPGSGPSTRMEIKENGQIVIGNNVPMWSGSFGGGLFLKGNNATSDRYAQLCIVDSNGSIAQAGLKINNNGSATFAGAITSTALTTTGGITAFSNFVIASDSGGVYLGKDNDSSLRLITNNTTRLTIANNGVSTFSSTVTSTGLIANVPTNTGLTINSQDVSAIQFKVAAGNQKNWGLASTLLAAGDFGLYQSTSTGGNPITAGAVKLYVSSSGNLIVGKSVANLTLAGLYVAPNDFMVYTNTSTDTGDRLLVLNRQNATGELVDFRYQNSTVGKITMNGSATNYGTGSDYRLKENVVTDWDATTRLKQLKPSRFNFITDADNTVDGFLAHEVSSVVPEAITGTKDAVDSEGNPDYQGIDQSKLVPLLVKTIQELEARITTLEG
jgi:hypothetical protein